MGLCINVAYALVFFGLTPVLGCDIARACGVVAKNIRLSEKEGFLHIDLEKYSNCDVVNHGKRPPPIPLNRTTIELQVIHNAVNSTEEQDQEKRVGAIGLKQSKESQPKYTVNYSKKSKKVIVAGDFGPGSWSSLFYTLPNLKYTSTRTPTRRVISFYSSKEQQMYFIYPKTNGKNGVASCGVTSAASLRIFGDEIGKNGVASCGVTSAASCEYSEMKSRLHPSIDTESTDLNVYDSLGLVALPVKCCTCRDKQYFHFDRATVVKSVDTLSGIWGTHLEADARIGMAYSAERINGGGLTIQAQLIPSRTTETKKIILSNKRLS
eukprot:CAMPEP_0194350188 /NCGR_PEP_ID=MMETSP0171-20130528/107502_1 /TAXON_ID=218684 /ORGANISM="Corethron pennatum, Strain L29A3" /LENGTH=322 /DNA_ID=CAMNT_0039117715 /DNA_START=82 /DNA_END=1046 /DNA_ORIENTATION=-